MEAQIKWIKNTFIYLLVRSLFGLIRCLSHPRGLAFGRWLGRVAFRRARVERERTLRHLAWAFDDLPQAEVRQLGQKVFEHLGAGLAELVNVHKAGPITDFVDLEPDSQRVLEEVLARGRGAVFVTGHCGNWELMARGLGLRGYPVNTIGQKSYDPRFTRLLSRFRDEGSVKTLWRGDPELIQKMAAVLRRGQIMGLLIDQDTSVPGTFVDFFGRPAWTPTAPAVLARKSGSPIIMGFNHRRSEGGYVISIKELMPCADDDFERAVQADTQAMSRAIEEQIRAHPVEWVWMHRRWKTRPQEQVH